MSASVSNPNSLTKDRLKKELLKNNITLPSSDSKKNVYVDLYRKHILSSLNVKKNISEFSSDEDSFTTTPKLKKKPGSPKKKPGSPQKPGSPLKKKALPKKPVTMDPMEVVDVYTLTDEELAQQLTLYNVELGPIMDTTRAVYQKKLERLLRGEVYSEERFQDEVDNSMEFSDLDDSEIIVSNQNVVEEPIETQRELRQRPQLQSMTEETSHHIEKISRKEVKTTVTKAASANGPAAPTKSSQKTHVTVQPTKRSSFSVCMQVAAVAVVAGIIFLVFQNMDQPAKISFL